MTTNNSTTNEHVRPRVILAPMAGITDLPFRTVCCTLGAEYAVSEMIGADPKFRNSVKTKFRLTLGDGNTPKVVQIAGAEPSYLADAARAAVDHGAEIVDINLGCPAKKVCNQAAGSALMKDEPLVARIFEKTVAAVAVPVTVKMRTGWDKRHINAPSISRIAEAAGIDAITVHGRTRACRFAGNAEYDTIRDVKRAVSIPVIANGDICSAEQAGAVLAATGCDGVMIGRAAQGNPWIFREVKAHLNDDVPPPRPGQTEILAVLADHLAQMHAFYGDFAVRLARKHIANYARWLRNGGAFRAAFNQLDTRDAQMRFIETYEITTINDHGVLAA